MKRFEFSMSSQLMMLSLHQVIADVEKCGGCILRYEAAGCVAHFVVEVLADKEDLYTEVLEEHKLFGNFVLEGSTERAHG